MLASASVELLKFRFWFAIGFTPTAKGFHCGVGVGVGCVWGVSGVCVGCRVGYVLLIWNAYVGSRNVQLA